MHTCKSGKSKFSPGSMPPNPPTNLHFWTSVFIQICVRPCMPVFIFLYYSLMKFICQGQHWTTFLSGLWMKEWGEDRRMSLYWKNKQNKQPKTTPYGKSRTAGRAGQGRAGQGKARQGKARHKTQDTRHKTQDTRQGKARQEQETFDDELAQDCKDKAIIKGANEEGNEERRVGQINQ